MPKTTTQAVLVRHWHQSPSQSDMWMKKLAGRVVMVGDCWIVDGKTNQYVRLSMSDGTGAMGQAHRLVYATFKPDEDITDMHVHHTCFNAGCINPEHLEAMTPEDHRALHAGQ